MLANLAPCLALRAKMAKLHALRLAAEAKAKAAIKPNAKQKPRGKAKR